MASVDCSMLGAVELSSGCVLVVFDVHVVVVVWLVVTIVVIRVVVLGKHRVTYSATKVNKTIFHNCTYRLSCFTLHCSFYRQHTLLNESAL